jgi:adapter protein MecA 1/2
MNIQQLGPDRLRVLLNPDDLDKYNLDYYTINKDNPETKILLNEILSQARKKGFYTFHSKILIEVVPLKNSGCVLYITKYPSGRPARTAQTGNNPSQYAGYILSCDNIDDTIEAIKHFADYPDIPMKRSSLYSYNHQYQLIFFPVLLGLDNNRLVSLLTALSEYGKTENCTQVREAILTEHGETILKLRAIENFILYFH